MKNQILAMFCLAGLSVLLSAQVGQAGVAEASAPAAVPSKQVVKRCYQVRFIGNQLTNGSALLRTLTSSLTENLGSIEYSAASGILTVTDTPEVLDKLMQEVASRDVEPGQVFLDIKIVKLTDPKTAERALAATGQSCEKCAAILNASQVGKALTSMKEERVDITQAPKLVALADQTASIFIGNKRSERMTPDGGASAPLDVDTVDFSVTPAVEHQTDRVRLNFQMRSLFNALDGAVLCQQLVAGSGETLVFQRFAAPDRGVMVFVTPSIIRKAATPK